MLLSKSHKKCGTSSRCVDQKAIAAELVILIPLMTVICDLESKIPHLKGNTPSVEDFEMPLLHSELMGMKTEIVSKEQAVPVSDSRTIMNANSWPLNFKLILGVAMISVIIGLIIGRSY
eukprot:Gb_35781 [translate_table: standard]